MRKNKTYRIYGVSLKLSWSVRETLLKLFSKVIIRRKTWLTEYFSWSDKHNFNDHPFAKQSSESIPLDPETYFLLLQTQTSFDFLLSPSGSSTTVCLFISCNGSTEGIVAIVIFIIVVVVVVSLSNMTELNAAGWVAIADEDALVTDDTSTTGFLASTVVSGSLSIEEPRDGWAVWSCCCCCCWQCAELLVVSVCWSVSGDKLFFAAEDSMGEAILWSGDKWLTNSGAWDFVWLLSDDDRPLTVREIAQRKRYRKEMVKQICCTNNYENSTVNYL